MSSPDHPASANPDITTPARIPRSFQFALFSIGLAQTFLFSVLPPLGREFGLSEIQVGAVFATSACFWVVCSPFWGRMSDRVGRKPIALIGMLGASTSVLMLAVVTTFAASMTTLITLVAMISARCINGLLGSATRPGIIGWVADSSTIQGRASAMSRTESGFTLGATCGPALGGFLFGFSHVLPFLLFVSITLVASFFVSRVPEVRERKVKAHPRPLSYLDVRIAPFIAVGVLMGINNSVYLQTFALYVADMSTSALAGWSSPAIAGLAFSITATMSFLAQQYVVGHSLLPVRVLRWLSPLCVLSGYAVIVFATTTQPVLLFLAAALMGIGGGALQSVLSAMMSVSVRPSEQGAAAGLRGSVMPLGHVLSPVLAMPLYIIDPQYPYIMALSLMAIMFLVLVTDVRFLRSAQRIDGDRGTLRRV